MLHLAHEIVLSESKHHHDRSQYNTDGEIDALYLYE